MQATVILPLFPWDSHWWADGEPADDALNYAYFGA